MKRLVVCIYGLTGNHKKFGEFFPKLIESNTHLSELYDTVSYSYRIGFLRYLFIKKERILEILTRKLRNKLRRRYNTYSQIAFICHGIGGLIARHYLVEEAIDCSPTKIDRILMVAVPNTRADLLRIYDSLSWKNRLEKAICNLPNVIETLNKTWADKDIGRKVAVKYLLGGFDNLIDESEALRQWEAGYFSKVENQDHWGLFTPENSDETVFQIAKRFLLAEAPVQKNYPKNLGAIATVLNWELDTTQLDSVRDDIIYLVDLLDQLEWRSRQLLCALIQKSNQVSYDEMFAIPSEISKTMNLTVQQLEAELLLLKKAELIDIVHTNESKKIRLKSTDERWLIWGQLRGYCQKSGIGLRRLIVDLQFDLLDTKEP